MKSGTTTVDRAESGEISLADKIEHEECLFRSIAAGDLFTYRGQFVALSGGKIIDNDWDELALAKRVSLLPKNNFILIHQITETDLHEHNN